MQWKIWRREPQKENPTKIPKAPISLSVSAFDPLSSVSFFFLFKKQSLVFANTSPQYTHMHGNSYTTLLIV